MGYHKTFKERNLIKQNKMKEKILLLVLILSIFFFRTGIAEEAQPVKTLTFNEFYQKVLVYYPKLKQQDVNINLAIIKKVQAAAGLMPRVQGSASLTFSNDPVFVFGSLLREHSFSQDNFELSKLNEPSMHTSYNFTLAGQVPIFDAFQTISRIRSAKLGIESARFEAAFTKMEALLVASESYLRTIAIENLLSNVTEIKKACEEDISQAEELMLQGLSLGADFYQAKVIFGNVSQLENQLLQERQAAHTVMNILMGMDPFTAFEIQGNLKSSGSEDKTLQTWLDEAYKYRPDLAAVDKTIQAQGIEVYREKSSALPRVNAFSEAREDTHSLNSGGGQNFTLGLKAEVDLFDPAYGSRVRASKETLKRFELEKDSLKLSINRDLANEFSQYKISTNNLPVIEKMLEDAKEALKLMLPLYREGRKSIAELLQSRDSYLNVAREYYTLAINKDASWTRLLFLSGGLNDERMTELNKRLTNE